MIKVKLSLLYTQCYVVGYGLRPSGYRQLPVNVNIAERGPSKRKMAASLVCIILIEMYDNSCLYLST